MKGAKISFISLIFVLSNNFEKITGCSHKLFKKFGAYKCNSRRYW